MSINSFIAQVWSARLLANLRNVLIYGQPALINRDYEGEIAMGSSLRINAIGKVSVGDYTKNANISDPEELADSSQVLTIERARYFNFEIDDVDRIQGRPDLMDNAMQEAAYALMNDMDQWLAAKMAAESGALLGSNTSPLVVGLGGTDRNAYEVLVDIAVAMDENNVPTDGRWIVVPPWFFGLLLKDARFVSFGTDRNADTLRNGEIGEAAGLSVFRSNNVPVSSGKWKVLASHPFSTTFAAQANQVEAYRPEKRFGDAVKGLMLYGAKVTRANTMVCATVQKGS